MIIKKYKDEINRLKERIEHMNWEWSKEKECYTKETKRKIYEQKVDMVIGGLDVIYLKDIHRPLYGLTSTDARKISEMIRKKLSSDMFDCTSYPTWNAEKDCYIIHVFLETKEDEK